MVRAYFLKKRLVNRIASSSKSTGIFYTNNRKITYIVTGLITVDKM